MKTTVPLSSNVGCSRQNASAITASPSSSLVSIHTTNQTVAHSKAKTNVMSNAFSLSINRSCVSSIESLVSEIDRSSSSNNGSSDTRSAETLDYPTIRSCSLQTSRSLPDLLVNSTARLCIRPNPLSAFKVDNRANSNEAEQKDQPANESNRSAHNVNMMDASQQTSNTTPSPFAAFRFQWPPQASPIKSSLVKLKQIALPHWFGSTDRSKESRNSARFHSIVTDEILHTTQPKLKSSNKPTLLCNVLRSGGQSILTHSSQPITTTDPKHTFELLHRPSLTEIDVEVTTTQPVYGGHHNPLDPLERHDCGIKNDVSNDSQNLFHFTSNRNYAAGPTYCRESTLTDEINDQHHCSINNPMDHPAHAYIRLNGSTGAYRPAHWINGVLGCLRPFIGSLSKLQSTHTRCQSSRDQQINANRFDANTSGISLESMRDNGRWEIPIQEIHSLRWIGSGAQGAVFQGEYNGQPVAVKQVHEQSDTELQHLRRLRHPNVIRLIGVCTKPPSFCIVMEYCEHGSLYEQLKRPAEVPLQRVCDWSRQVCDGMLYLHQNRIIHRDLKSPNVLLSDRFTLKISDFGASRTQQQGAHSMQMSVAGTVAWMAPEVIRNEKCSEKVDVWSYGVMLWELLTCQVPYAQVESSRVILGVGNHDLRLPIPDACPNAMRALIQRCWSSRPRNRPSFGQLAVLLQPALSEMQRTLAAVDLCAVRRLWQKEVAAKLVACGTSQRKRLQRNRNQLELAQQLRQHYEQKLQRANRLYAEASALFEQLQQRERQLKRREHELSLKSAMHAPFARSGSIRRLQHIRPRSRSRCVRYHRTAAPLTTLQCKPNANLANTNDDTNDDDNANAKIPQKQNTDSLNYNDSQSQCNIRLAIETNSPENQHSKHTTPYRKNNVSDNLNSDSENIGYSINRLSFDRSKVYPQAMFQEKNPKTNSSIVDVSILQDNSHRLVAENCSMNRSTEKVTIN